MKFSVKIGVGFLGVVAVVLSIALFVVPQKASAYVARQDEIAQGVKLSFVDRQTIEATFPDGGKVIFSDDRPYDNNPNYQASDYDCEQGETGGINLKNASGKTALGNSVPAIVATVDLDYRPSTGQNCQNTSREDFEVTISNPSNFFKILKVNDKGELVVIGDTTNAALRPYSTLGTADPFVKDQKNNVFYSKAQIEKSKNGCKSQVVINGNSAVYYSLAANGSGDTVGSLPSSGIDANTSCKVLSSVKLLIAGDTTAVPTGGGSSGGVGSADSTGADDPSCEKTNPGISGTVMCWIIEQVDGAATSLMSYVEDLLVINTKELFTPDLKKAWSGVRMAATVSIVIVMLVMIISQAISWGPFDAYTIRKLLPRLVIAVIAIQLSWSLLQLIIEAVNQIGLGLADLLYAPFGGSEALSYQAVVDKALDLNGKGVAAGAGIFTIASVVGIGIAVVALPFLMLSLALSAFISVLIGYLVLIIRQILMILIIILAPLAFLMWVLPGTRKYWNLWQETLEKLLMMFPLIIGFIAAGRILAFVAASGDIDPTSGIGNLGLVKITLITMGFFLPFWLLPKTFQWGGSILSKVTGITNDRSKGVFDRARNGLQNRQKEFGGIKKEERAKRIAKDGGDWWRGDKVISGKNDPLLSPEMRRRRIARYVAAGKSAASDSAKEDFKASGIESKDYGTYTAEMAKLASDKTKVGQKVKLGNQEITVTDHHKQLAFEGLIARGAYDRKWKTDDAGNFVLDDRGNRIESGGSIEGVMRNWEGGPEAFIKSEEWQSAQAARFGDVNTAAPQLAKGKAPATDHDPVSKHYGRLDELMKTGPTYGWKDLAWNDYAAGIKAVATDSTTTGAEYRGFVKEQIDNILADENKRNELGPKRLAELRNLQSLVSSGPPPPPSSGGGSPSSSPPSGSGSGGGAPPVTPTPPPAPSSAGGGSTTGAGGSYSGGISVRPHTGDSTLEGGGGWASGGDPWDGSSPPPGGR